MIKRLLPPLMFTVFLLIAAGCAADGLPPQAQRLVSQIRLASEASAPPAEAANQLLVSGADGNLFLVDAATGARFALTTDASPQRQYLQPVWSPDGMQIAWARREGRRSFLETIRFDGADRRELDVPFLPFYLAWSPVGDRLAYLSNWLSLDQPSMALRVVEFDDDGGRARTLAEGQPFYFSWAPDGQRLLTHVGNERVELLSLDGVAESLQISGGQFPTPQWAADGERLLYATADAVRQRLIVTDLQGQELTELTDYPGRISFSLSPDGARVAYVVTERMARSSSLGPLYVVDVATLQTREVTANPVLAFYWSPSGERLAYLGLEFVAGQLGLRWYVWNGRTSTPFAGFLPSRAYLDHYLPFFDQYAQSHRVWSADSSAFVFAGTLTDGRSGVWVQKVVEGSEPAFIGPGVFAAWAPR
ncbi:MAG: PD40 domain-containing protein [Caldilineaceae bacterium]|nr:PD40 domain-containing protein [Caldilineaceae bacterium]